MKTINYERTSLSFLTAMRQELFMALTETKDARVRKLIMEQIANTYVGK